MNAKTCKLFTAALAAGALTACLRLLLYRVGFDEKNILSFSHPLHLACLALAGFMALYLWFSVKKQEERRDSVVKFPSGLPRRCCMLAAGILIVLRGIALFREADAPLAFIRAVLALAAACSMVLCALLPPKLQTMHNLCQGIITTFFALDMLCRYQDWSGNPQLPDYVFQIFACVLLSLCSYHRLAFDVGLGKQRSVLWCGLMAMYLSIACVSGPETRIFYLGSALWAGSCLYTAEPAALKE